MHAAHATELLLQQLTAVDSSVILVLNIFLVIVLVYSYCKTAPYKLWGDKNRPIPFLSQTPYEETKSGFSFECLFCVVISVLRLTAFCLFYCARFNFFSANLSDWLERTSPNDLFLCWVECETLTQSIGVVKLYNFSLVKVL